MRACGLPVAIDCVKAWGNRSMGHEWNVLLLDSGKIFPFDALNGYKLEFAYKPAKIYRKRFSLTAEKDLPPTKDVPRYLACPDELDVTNQYGRTFDIRIPCTKPWTGDNKKQYGLICVFDNVSWKPVYWGKIEDGQIYFQRMMGDVCYMAAYYNKGKIVPASEPFILEKNGNIVYLNVDRKANINMTLKRKYPRFTRMEQFAISLRRTKIRGANNKQFKNPTLLMDIINTPKDVVDSIIKSTLKFRYLQVEPASYRTGDLAEIEFYGKKYLNEPEHKLVGRVFGYSELPMNNGHPYEHAMDGDYETYYSKERNKRGYVAYDLGTPYYITRVRYCPRSDSNFIIPGHNYQLCYWDSQWKSVGSKVATEFSISFKNVPQGTFYILHDLTKGKEERIFTYENGMQIWW